MVQYIIVGIVVALAMVAAVRFFISRKASPCSGCESAADCALRSLRRGDCDKKK